MEVDEEVAAERDQGETTMTGELLIRGEPEVPSEQTPLSSTITEWREERQVQATAESLVTEFIAR